MDAVIELETPVQVKSLAELKALAEKVERPPNTCVIFEAYISLAGGIARSSKTIQYYIDEDKAKPYRMRKVWHMFEYICDTWIECTDKSLATNTNIIEAMEAGAFSVESITYS